MFLPVPRPRLLALTAATLATTLLLAGCDSGEDTIPARTCVASNGPGSTRGLQLFGAGSYSGLVGAASSSGTVMLDPGEISFINPNLAPTATTGSLRAAMYAVAGDYSGAVLNAYLVARYSILFTGGDTTLTNGDTANLQTQTLAAVTPTRGSYCIVVALEEYDPASCPSNSDGYCIVDWTEFPSSVMFY